MQSLQDPPGPHSLSDSVAPTLPGAPVTGRNTLGYGGLNEQGLLLTERAPGGGGVTAVAMPREAPGVQARLPAPCPQRVCTAHGC